MSAPVDAPVRPRAGAGGVAGNTGRRYQARLALGSDLGRLVELARFAPSGRHLPSLAERFTPRAAVALGVALVEAAAVARAGSAEYAGGPVAACSGRRLTVLPGAVSGRVRLRVRSSRRQLLSSYAESFPPEAARALGLELIEAATGVCAGERRSA